MKILRLKIGVSLLLLLISATTCGCQKTPTQAAVAGKTTDASRSNATGSSSLSELLEPNQTQAQGYWETFSSLDGNVNINFEIDEIAPIPKTSIIEVSPHYLTNDDVKAVAHSLFGETSFFEARMRTNDEYSRKEIQERIKRWTQFTNSTAILELYGEDNGKVVDKLKRSIEKHTTLCETAPDEVTAIPAKWHFQKESVYYLSEDELRNQDISKDNDAIMIETKAKDIQYILQAARRNQSDFKLNTISAFFNTKGSPSQIDARIYQSMLCRTAKPDAENLHWLRDIAEEKLKIMNLGEWKIDQCYVEEQLFGETSEFIIHICAVPVLEGVPALRHPQIQNLKSEDVYASNYYLTDVEFEFSANGDLISFWLFSPIDMTEVKNDNIELLSTEALLSKAKQMLQLSDLHTYDVYGVLNTASKVGCTIKVTEMCCGLSRIKAANSDENYYYVPSVIFNGTVTYYDEESGMVYYSSNELIPFLTLNSVDGTVIANN